ncbi:hypothetical protein ACFV80_24300 [Streptomyces sp. NPDC059862]|uniref:hypothetical protein n=1 Tax=Streptomyces sp. NPDC059862 TaxID=3346975 RepID=UPI003650D35A
MTFEHWPELDPAAPGRLIGNLHSSADLRASALEAQVHGDRFGDGTPGGALLVGGVTDMRHAVPNRGNFTALAPDAVRPDA